MIWLLGTLAASVAAFVLYPVFASAPPEVLVSMNEREWSLKALIEQKARLLDVIKDLEFEKDSGKVPQAVYELSRSDYMNQVASVLRQMDELSERPAPKPSQKGHTETPSDKAEQRPTKGSGGSTTQDTTEDLSSAKLPCPHCEAENPGDARFCMQCGKPTSQAAACSKCSAELPDAARYCLSCGEKVPGAP